ncbi:ergosterol biosynthesis protein-like protein [Corynespora cassiicola Philippines]|uniref:Ergosterol biosynthesis protein-like protein n=1 Tax=Corynespora cassiicola Philippines TaxID=1448308 RepID=A0A2T2NUQ6_CORCC|nr:ergosterol biosynthesis protein-like protein [Corynespora cassiicola Philippines]
MASALTSYLPEQEGLLPKWLLLVSIISIGNSIQCYSTLHFTQRLYNGSATTMAPANVPARTIKTPSQGSPEAPSQVTPLSSRTFGTWTALTGLVRLYAAYNLDNEAMYRLAIWTYGVAWIHFMSEWLVFKTTKWATPLAGPVIIATSSLVWMWLQWDFYVKN